MSGDNETSKALKAALGKASHPIYAVLDGAKFDNLPDLLFDHDFSHKPLYRDMGSEIREIAQTTPQFIRFDKWAYWENDLTPAQRLDALLELFDDTSAAVFWEYEGEPKRLFRHLRTINNVMIPRDADTPPLPDPLDPDGETYGNTATHQQVLFRHADANVMAQVLPTLSPPQLTRFMGPATAVTFAPQAEWGDGKELIKFDNPRDTYNSSHPLKLSQDDMDAIDQRRLIGQRWATVKYLRTKTSLKTTPNDEKELYAFVLNCDKQGEKLGLVEDEAYRAWSLLAVLSDGKTLNDPMLHNRFIKSYKSPDKMVVEVLAEWEAKT